MEFIQSSSLFFHVLHGIRTGSYNSNQPQFPKHIPPSRIPKEAKEAKEAKGDTKADRQKAALERLRNIKKKRPLVAATAERGEVKECWMGGV